MSLTPYVLVELIGIEPKAYAVYTHKSLELTPVLKSCQQILPRQVRCQTALRPDEHST
ncbi:MAG: hypothetical protein H6Q56_868 [Deltaproteobacteria bacterium]|nr:hypothetical protein [Deltaproteobacteria bacterium]